MLRKISKVFYDKVYAHPWIGKYFAEVKQEVIEAQQVDFMAQALGGPKMYCGKFVPQAHQHMVITEELFELREQLLDEAMKEFETMTGIKPSIGGSLKGLGTKTARVGLDNQAYI